MYVIPKLCVNRFIAVPIKPAGLLYQQYRTSLQNLQLHGAGDTELPPMFSRKTDAIADVMVKDAEQFNRESEVQ